MKQTDKKILIWLSFIFYMINIANILLSIALFLNGEMAYFIVFWSLFSIDKIVTFVFGVIGKGMYGFVFWISDILQLGFIFIIFSKKVPFTLEGALLTKLLGRIFPLIISELIIFFGCGFLSRPEVTLYVQILAYVNYVLFLVLAIIVLTLISTSFPNKLHCFFEYLVTISSYYLTLASLLQFQDLFGVNLGFYYLSFFLINIAIFLIVTPPQELKGLMFENIFSQFLGNTLLNSYFNHTKVVANRNTALVQCTTIVSYLNQLVRISLLLIFSFDFFVETLTEPNQSSRNIICLTNIFLSAIMSALYLIYYFKLVLKQIFCVKILLIRNVIDMQRAIKYLQQKNKHLEVLYIQIYSNVNGQIQYFPHHKVVEMDHFCSETCFFSFKLLQEIGNQQNKKIEVYDDGSIKIFCKCFMMRLLSEQSNIIPSIQSEISYRIQNSSYIFSKIMLERYTNGFVQALYTQKILKQNIDLFNVSPIKHLRSNIFSINAYYKHIKDQMIFQPKIILYDLYE
ncbi:hypothetical protein ABPG72_020224 [Tetrahymena utriculariae]